MKYIIFIPMALIFLTGSLSAQFPGDVFFADPSPLVVEGTTTTLTVEAFAGTSAFGAAQFRVAYDPTRVEFVGASASQSTLRTVTIDAAQGKAVAVLNGRQLSAPIGTVSLVDLQFRPLVPAGQTVSVAITAPTVLTTSGVPFAQSMGFGATLTVVSPAATVTGSGASTPETSVTPPWLDAVPWRRLGALLALPYALPDGRFTRIPFQTRDPNVPREGTR